MSVFFTDKCTFSMQWTSVYSDDGEFHPMVLDAQVVKNLSLAYFPYKVTVPTSQICHQGIVFSYNLCIGDTDPTTDEKILRDWTAKGIGFWSQTTSTHVNLARRFADKVCNGT